MGQDGAQTGPGAEESAAPHLHRPHSARCFVPRAPRSPRRPRVLAHARTEARPGRARKPTRGVHGAEAYGMERGFLGAGVTWAQAPQAFEWPCELDTPCRRRCDKLQDRISHAGLGTPGGTRPLTRALAASLLWPPLQAPPAALRGWGAGATCRWRTAAPVPGGRAGVLRVHPLRGAAGAAGPRAPARPPVCGTRATFTAQTVESSRPDLGPRN